MYSILIAFCIITLIVILIVCAIEIWQTIYNVLRAKYKVVEIVIDPVKGPKAVAEKKFWNKNRALTHYNKCLKTCPDTQLYYL